MKSKTTLLKRLMKTKMRVSMMKIVDHVMRMNKMKVLMIKMMKLMMVVQQIRAP